MRQILAEHQQLIRDLILILISCLICFLYFNEQWTSQSQQLRQESLNNLAAQLANNSYVPLAADNFVSLNVLTQELASRPPVKGVRIEHLEGKVASSAGTFVGMRAVAPIGSDSKRIIGRAVIYASPPQAQPWWPFLLLVICLLALRITLTFFLQSLLPQSLKQWQRLKNSYLSVPMKEQAAAPESVDNMSIAWLDICINDHEQLQQRFTPGALVELIKSYDKLLRQVTEAYGISAEPMTQKTRIALRHSSENEALFLLACAACLFQRFCEWTNEQRRDAGEACLSFSLLLYLPGAPHEWAKPLPLGLLLPGLPEKLGERLQCHQVGQWQLDDTEWKLLALDKLAERYRKLVDAQLANMTNEPAA